MGHAFSCLLTRILVLFQFYVEKINLIPTIANYIEEKIQRSLLKLNQQNLDATAGPKTGKPRTYKGIQIPINNNRPLIRIISKRRCKIRNVHPSPIPNKPVVNGKINSSLGSINNNKKIVSI